MAFKSKLLIICSEPKRSARQTVDQAEMLELFTDGFKSNAGRSVRIQIVYNISYYYCRIHSLTFGLMLILIFHSHISIAVRYVWSKNQWMNYLSPDFVSLFQCYLHLNWSWCAMGSPDLHSVILMKKKVFNLNKTIQLRHNCKISKKRAEIVKN